MSPFVPSAEPVALDPARHRQLRFAPRDDWSGPAAMHASFLAAVEFASAARDFVIVFVHGQAAGRSHVEPLVLLGVREGENLFVEGERWDARYVPAYIRRLPFWLATAEGSSEPVMMVNERWGGFSATEGDALYDEGGQPCKRLAEALEFSRQFEAEAVRTLQFCHRVAELGLLHNLNVNVKLASGQEIKLDGLLSIDEAKLQKLPNAQVIELHRSGMLGLIHAHLLSLANMQGLADRKSRRVKIETAG